MAINEFLSLVGAVLSGIALTIAAMRLWVSIIPVRDRRRTKAILDSRLSRGPFDEATIEQATRHYIRPKFSTIDPALQNEPRHAFISRGGDLFEQVDDFLSSDLPQKHLFVLADSGTGKTSFLLNYYAYNYKKPHRLQHHLYLIPLGADNAMALINEIEDRENAVIFLDALDEDTRAIADYHSRILELMTFCRGFSKVLLTCRTQFFPQDSEIPIDTGLIRFGPRKAGEGRSYEFGKIFLSPFNDEDVEKYLKKRYRFWQKQQRSAAKRIIEKIPLLSVRPMLLTHIPDIVASNKEVNSSYELYEIMVQAWVKRETAWADKNALHKFSERLAMDLYVNRRSRKMERAPMEVIRRLAKKWSIKLQPWVLSGRSLLNRDFVGNYKFAHRSIMEYLCIRALFNDSFNYDNMELTDQMTFFLIERLCTTGFIDSRTESLLRASSVSAKCIGKNAMDKLHADENRIIRLMEPEQTLLYRLCCPIISYDTSVCNRLEEAHRELSVDNATLELIYNMLPLVAWWYEVDVDKYTKLKQNPNNKDLELLEATGRKQVYILRMFHPRDEYLLPISRPEQGKEGSFSVKYAYRIQDLKSGDHGVVELSTRDFKRASLLKGIEESESGKQMKADIELLEEINKKGMIWIEPSHGSTSRSYTVYINPIRSH
jgi:hypothetical protein